MSGLYAEKKEGDVLGRERKGREEWKEIKSDISKGRGRREKKMKEGWNRR